MQLLIRMFLQRCSDLRVSGRSFRTFARTLPPLSKVSKSVISLLRYYRWDQAVLVVSDRGDNRLIADVLGAQAREHNVTVQHTYYVPNDYRDDANGTIRRIIRDSHTATRVYVLLAETGVLVDFVRLMHQAGLLEGGEYVIVSVEEEDTYDRRNKYQYMKKEHKNIVLANSLLCFVMSGLSTSYRIPVGYFFTKGLTGAQLHELVLFIMKKVETCGFRITRLITDNHKVNVHAFKLLGYGCLTYRIEHPCDPERPLFLSFDPCHVLKNVRSQFLAHDIGPKGEISPSHLKAVYELQKDLTVRPVRYLSRKHVYPNNIEKMNVGRAVQVLSPAVTAALEHLKEQAAVGELALHTVRTETQCWCAMNADWEDSSIVRPFPFRAVLLLSPRVPSDEHYGRFSEAVLSYAGTQPLCIPMHTELKFKARTL
ncbi:hypothetical protein HPB49_017844 [Dermacentor silvarum]|uniref:Uncharacterized protein n=1 Tax=Dermacentor silvarum TaxID=543639 RepID=A0ACB8CS48_DERSI|nr:hypothetical protein HPB49_017844 [Dermacentor silvarum]